MFIIQCVATFSVSFCFFFQAEDGIRDHCVTGVQTCALPIYKHIATHLRKTELACRLHYHQMSYGSNRRRRTESMSSSVSSYRSEERRVGKECRSRWWP